MKVESWPIGKVKPYKKNPRIHNGAVDAVAKSIELFGFKQPLVVTPKGSLIVGHARHAAAKKLKLKTVPVVVARFSADKARAYRIADNKTNELADWDPELLASELKLIDDVKWTELGFTEKELDELYGDDQAADEAADAVPETPAEPVTKPGDVWTMGDHQLLCGDCTDAASWRWEYDAMVADPPYNLGKQYDSDTDDDRTPEDYRDWCASWFQHAHADSTRMVFPGPKHAGLWWTIDRGYVPMAWIKRNGQGNTPFGGTGKWEPLMVWGYPHDRGLDTIEVNNDYSERIVAKGDHIVPKPVELITTLLKRFATERVIDPFMGSGTTLIACEKLGLVSLGIELSPRYCDVIVRRWEEYTGREASHTSA